MSVVRIVLSDRRIRYVITGSFGSLVYYGLFSLGWLISSGWLFSPGRITLAGPVTYLGLALLANLGSSIATYPLYRQRVFAASGPPIAGFFRFYAVSLGGLVFSLGGLPLLVELAGVPVLLAQAILLVVWPLLNYQVLKLWAFRKREPAFPVQVGHPAVPGRSGPAR